MSTDDPVAGTPEGSALGKSVGYADQYNARLLYAIPRAPQRARLGLALGGQPPFSGADWWTAYELSWLNSRGKPQLAIAHILVPCESTHMIEGKSFKLYLNSFNGTVFADAEAVCERIRSDISAVIWSGGAIQQSAGVRLLLPDEFAAQRLQELEGLSLDRLDIECTHSRPAPELLTAALDEKPVEEVLTSRLFKSNCPVTGQPDWASIRIRYTGPQIDQGGLLRYLVSFRQHSDFHEHCVERIFTDIRQRCHPARLAVYARYTRRGGLDINPYRTSHPGPVPDNTRTARQ